MLRTLLAVLISLTFVGLKAQTSPIYPFDIKDVFQLDPSHDQSCEYYFVSPHDGYNLVDPDYRSILMIADRNGELLFFKGFPGTSDLFYNFVFDLKVQPNGQITYHMFANGSAHYVMDSTLTVVDTLTCKNGLSSDAHELRITEDGYRYHLCSEYRTMDLDTLVSINNEPLSSNASVRANAIQIIDPNDQLIYEWNGFDHLEIGDMDYTNLDDTLNVDWMHANSIDLDENGNMIMSIRNFNEVINISRQDSSIIWRLGGKHSDFVFANDTLQFTLQHHATWQPNKRITLLDNGTYHNPPVARAIEYELNATNDTVDLVWEYLKNIESLSLGSHQILPNGNHLINWGGELDNFSSPIVEVDENYSEELNIEFPSSFFTYRAFCNDLPWQVKRPEITCGYDSTNGNITLASDTGYNSYYWLNLGDTVTSIVTQDTGRYQIFGYNGFGWVGSETFYINDLSNPCDTVDTIIGIAANVELGSQIKLYPNPATDQVYISLPDGLINTSSEIEVYNAIGQLVYKTDVQQQQLTAIRTADLGKGTYIVTLRNPLANWRGRFVVTE